jgi:hypothetical protein
MGPKFFNVWPSPQRTGTSLYNKKQKVRIGEGAYLKVSKISIEFHEVLSKFHKERIEYLKTLGWIITESL